MTETMMATYVAGGLGIVGTLVGSLFGIILNAFIEHKRRRERYLQTVFDRKIKAYELISEWCTLFRGNTGNGHNWEFVFSENKELFHTIKKNDLFLSNEVYNLINKFSLAVLSCDFNPSAAQEILPLILMIRAQCQKELGIIDLQTMFSGNTTRS